MMYSHFTFYKFIYFPGNIANRSAGFKHMTLIGMNQNGCGLKLIIRRVAGSKGIFFMPFRKNYSLDFKDIKLLKVRLNFCNRFAIECFDAFRSIIKANHADVNICTI